MSRSRWSGGLAAAAFLLSTGAQAQQAERDALSGGPPDERVTQEQRAGETTVTARKIEEPKSNVPGSISALTAAQLRDAGATTVREASGVVPNLLVTEFTSRRLSFPFLRGIGSGQGEPAVVTYVDGVPQLSTGSTNLPLFGLRRIEFLRGPQGTLYGRNSLGGVIHLISEPPSDELRLEASATGGDHGLQEYGLSWSGPVVPGELALGLSGLFSTRDGYTTNDFTGHTLDDREAFFGRAQALWTPDARNEIRFDLHGERARDGGFALGLVPDLEQNPHHVSQDFEGVVERDLVAPSLSWRHLGDTLDFTSITSYQAWDVLETSDFDFSPLDGVVRTATEEQDYVYQELRVSSAEDRPLALGARTDLAWLAGMSFFWADSQRAAINDFRLIPPGPGIDTNTGSFDDLGLGVFGQATATVDERLDLTAGLRFDAELKEADLRNTFAVGGVNVVDVANAFDDEFYEVVPHVSVAYRFAEGSLVYGSASMGYKAGGFNLSAPTGGFGFEPEQSLSYEVGVKQAFLDDAAHVSLALYYIDWEDMQLSLFDPAAGGYVDNVGESNSQGIELEADARVGEHLTLFAGFGLSDTEFDEYVDPFGQNVAGNDLPFAPETTWSLAAQYGGELGARSRWFVRGEYVAIGDFFYDAGNLGQESYALANFRAGVERDALRLELWARNAFDEEYIPVAFQPNPADPSVFVGESGAPSTWGVTLRGSL